MARRPNYGQERAERQRRKAARRDERLAAKADKRDKSPASDSTPQAAGTHSPEPGLKLSAWTPDDPSAMLRLGRALTFVCGADHATTLAVQRAAMSGDGDDIDRARTLFLQLTPSNQHAALTIAGAGPSALR